MSLETFISTAEEQVGNGGSTYQTWMNLGENGNWCAASVSWCANEADILTADTTAGPQMYIKPQVWTVCGNGIMITIEHSRFLR